MTARASRLGAVAFAAAAALGLCVPATHAQGRDLAAVISVTGQASVAIVPDHAQLRVGVTSQGASAREASEINGSAMAAVMAALNASGVAEKDIQTSRLTLQPVSEQDRVGPARITGFRASNQLTVTVHAIDKLSELIDRLVAAGANDIGGIEFRVSSPSQALDDARLKAIADARRKAEIYAQAAGVTLGKPVSISEGGAIPLPATRSDMTAALATIVSPGERTLNVTVNVSFEFMR